MKKYIQNVGKVVLAVVAVMYLTGCTTVMQLPQGQQRVYAPQQPVGFENSGHTETIKSADGLREYTNYYNRGNGQQPVVVQYQPVQQPQYVGGYQGVQQNRNVVYQPVSSDGRPRDQYGQRIWSFDRNRRHNNSPVYVPSAPSAAACMSLLPQ